MNKNVMKCNLEVYSALVLKFGSTTMRPYNYEIKVENNLKVNIHSDVVNKVVIVSLGSKKLSISTSQYDHLVLIVNNRNFRQLISTLVPGSEVLVILHKASGIKKAKRNDYKQDPTMIKKGKYRHHSKAF